MVELSGSVEIAPRLGTADLICDLVSSGATLAANQLKPVQTLLESEAVLAGNTREPNDLRAGLLAMLLKRMDGVLHQRDSKLLMFRAAGEQQVDALRRLLPDADPLERLPDDGSGAAAPADHVPRRGDLAAPGRTRTGRRAGPHRVDRGALAGMNDITAIAGPVLA